MHIRFLVFACFGNHFGGALCEFHRRHVHSYQSDRKKNNHPPLASSVSFPVFTQWDLTFRTALITVVRATSNDLACKQGTFAFPADRLVVADVHRRRARRVVVPSRTSPPSRLGMLRFGTFRCDFSRHLDADRNLT